MNGIATQFRQLVREQEQIKKRLKDIEPIVRYAKKAIQHEKDIAKARKDKRRIPMEKLFRDLGI